MRVNESTGSGGYGSSIPQRSGSGTGTSFSDVFAAVQQAQTGSTAAATTSSTVSGASSTVAAAGSTGSSSSIADPQQYFLDYMSKTPEERMFDSFLSSNKISKADYEAMSDSEKQKVLAKFKEYVKEKSEESLGVAGLSDGGSAGG